MFSINKFASKFFFFEGGESFNVGFLFFYNFEHQKKKPDVLGILIICQHCFTFNFFFKNVLNIFIPKILPIILILLRSNFFHDFILTYLKKRGKNKNHVL